MKTFSLLSFLLLLLVAAAVSVHAAAAPATGGFYPIGDIGDWHIQDLGSWAVTEHNNRQANDTLRFNRVVSGEWQPTAGNRYHLTIDAMNASGVHGMYRADLVEDVYEVKRSFVSFVPAN